MMEMLLPYLLVSWAVALLPVFLIIWAVLLHFHYQKRIATLLEQILRRLKPPSSGSEF